MKSTDTDFGVLNPGTTAVLQFPNGHHRLLRGEAGGERGWPYPPEVLQRASNQHWAGLGVTLRMRGNDIERTLGRGKTGRDVSIQDFVSHLRHEVNQPPERALTLNDFSLFLVKMRRPAAPQGVEWNAPGGVAKAKEDQRGTIFREWGEEVSGLRVLATSLLVPGGMAASGVYREYYALWGIIATGTPTLASDEGALAWTLEPLETSLQWCCAQNAVAPERPECCWVDLKVILGLALLLRDFAVLGIA